MNVDGYFEELSVTDNTDSETVFDDVRFIQDGFSFTTFVDFEYTPFFDRGYAVVGYIDGDAVARGTIQSISPTRHEGEKYLRLSVAPHNDVVSTHSVI